MANKDDDGKDNKANAGRPLYGEDQSCWDAVKKTVKALHPPSSTIRLPKTRASTTGVAMKPASTTRGVAFERDKSTFDRAVKGSSSLQLPQQQQKKTSAHLPQLVLTHFDRTAHKKLAKGRLRVDDRLDLHGLKQGEAYPLLLHFIQSAQGRGLRHILVITGKGTSAGSQGVLKQSVPHWLSTAPLRFYVSAFEVAARNHGGQGALYIRLRRQK